MKTEPILKTIDTLIAFKEFQVACGGVEPKENWKMAIENLRTDYFCLQEKFDISITNKIHIITDHVEQYIAETGKGLGQATDQTVEALPT